MRSQIYERKIIGLIGLQTYQALLYLYPTLYQKQYDDNFSVPLYYIQLVQQITTVTKWDGNQLKEQILEAVKRVENGQDTKDMIVDRLINSSPVPTYYASSFEVNAWWFLFVSLFSIFLVAVLLWIFQGYYPLSRNLSLYPCKLPLP